MPIGVGSGNHVGDPGARSDRTSLPHGGRADVLVRFKPLGDTQFAQERLAKLEGRLEGPSYSQMLKSGGDQNAGP